MEKMEYWQLCDRLSVVQAALLIVEMNPNENPDIMKLQEHEKPENFSAVFTALKNAILGNLLPADILRIKYGGWEEEDKLFRDQYNFPEEAIPVWEKTTILVDDLRVWLESRNFKEGFFFPQSENAHDYLDKNHEHYAPKLNAAIKAWQAVNADPKLSAGKTVSQALSNWLRKNVKELGLVKPDGKPNEQAFKEIAKISNWKPKGGAPKTPY